MYKRIRERFGYVRTDLKVTWCRLASGDVTCLEKTDRIVIFVSAFLALLLLAVLPCFAGGDLISDAGDMAKNYYSKLFEVVTFVAGLAAIICLIWIAVSPTTNGAKVPLEWLKRILVSYAVIMLLNGIFALIRTATGGGSGTLSGS